MRAAVLDCIYELAKTDDRILFMGSDLGKGTLDQFKREMPERFFMEGISEAHLIGMAAGLAFEGRIPYVNTIATFLTRRCFEQIAVDLCLHSASVRLIGNGGGLVYAPLGPTHQAIEDLAILRALPNMTIVAPADANEMRRLMPATVDHPGPIYIRVAKGSDPLVTPEGGPFEIGKAFLMRTGEEALVLTTGITLKIALEAASALENQGIGIAILHVPTLKPLDREAILAKAEEVPIVIAFEEHSIVGGLGSAIAEIIAEANFRPSKKFARLGIPDVFPDQYGSQESLMGRFGLTVDRLISTILKFLEQTSARYSTANLGENHGIS
ncbi:MAG: transketolase [Planctomycetes bacterium]|nr:transketolase [Planctomycetota bacterium]